MLTQGRRILSLAALGLTAGFLLALVGIPYGRANYRAFAELYHGPTSTAGYIHIAIDCDPSTPVTDDACNVAAGVRTFDVAVTIGNSTAATTNVSSMNFTVRTDQAKMNPFPNFDNGAEGNPDVSNTLVGSGSCNYPIPDKNPDPAVADSALNCSSMLPTTQLPPSPAHLILAEVHYANIVPFGDYASLSLIDVAVFDETFGEIASCNPVVTTEGLCFGATINFQGTGGCYNNAANADGNLISNAPLYGTNDLTLAKSDTIPDCADPDMDNDGLGNFQEFDVNGEPACLGASATNLLLADTDGDRFLDGAECKLGSDPGDAGSIPAPIVGLDADSDGVPNTFDPNSSSVDSDGDGIRDGIEFRFYNTTMTSTNTDGDACGDAREIASIDAGNGVSAGDQLLLVLEIMRIPPPAKLRNFDLNKDGAVNAGDQLFMVQFFGMCP